MTEPPAKLATAPFSWLVGSPPMNKNRPASPSRALRVKQAQVLPQVPSVTKISLSLSAVFNHFGVVVFIKRSYTSAGVSS